MSNDLTKEQEIELFQSFKAKGYINLTKEEKSLWKIIKEKNYPELETKKAKVAVVDPNNLEKVQQEVKNDQAATNGGAPNNPFDPEARKKSVQIETPLDDFDTTKEYVLVENVLHSGDWFNKGFVIAGTHPQAKLFARKGFIIKK